MKLARLTTTVALAAAFGAPIAAARAAAQSADEHVRAGVEANTRMDPRAVLTHFEAALAADSMHYEANFRAALALIDLGKQTPDEEKSAPRDSMYGRAEFYARRAVAANPNGADGHFTLANAIGRASLTMSKKERVKRAAEIRNEALKAIELDPKHDGAYHVLGRWNAEIMRLSGMTRFFAKSFLGADVFNQASWEGAVANMEKAVELDPQRIYHRLDLAEIYIDRKRTDDARLQLQKVATLPATDVMDPQYKAQAARLSSELRSD